MDEVSKENVIINDFTNHESIIPTPIKKAKSKETPIDIKIFFESRNSSKEMVKNVGLETESYESRKNRMANISEKPDWEDFINSKTKEEIESDDFFAKTLLTYLTSLDKDNLQEEIQKIRQVIATKTTPHMYDLPTYEEFKKSLNLLAQLAPNQKFEIDLINDAYHVTSLENALVDIEAGSHKPSSHFPQNAKRGTTHFMLQADPKQQKVYQKFITEGHEDNVFFSSSSRGNIMTQVSLYSQEGIPVVFWTRKEDLNELGITQTAGEYNAYKGEIRLKGSVPINITKIVFTDLEKISNETLDSLKKLSSVYDIRILHVINLITSYNHHLMKDLDPTISEVMDLPKGKFDIEPSHIIDIQKGLSTKDKIRERITSAKNRVK